MSTRFERFGVVSGLVLESGDRWADVATRVQVDDVRAVLRGEPPFAFITRSRGYSKTTVWRRWRSSCC